MSVSGITMPPPLTVVAGVADPINAAVQEAMTDVVSYATTHSPEERWGIGAYALRKMKWSPNDEKTKIELEFMKALAQTRTPEGIEAARFWSKQGMDVVWEAALGEYAKSAGPAQARAAAKLLKDVLDQVNETTQIAKAADARKRPYDQDPSLTYVLDKPGNSPSYPSGHTTAAFAGATVLAYLMPHRAKEFMGLAMQGSYARVYGGVHFPSDVAAGAKIGSTMAAYLCSVSGVREMGQPAQHAPRGKRRKQGHARRAA